MTAATEMVNLGLRDLGYEYVNSKFFSFFLSTCLYIFV